MENDKITERLLASDHAALDYAFDAVIQAIDGNNAAESFARLDLLWARLGMHIRAEHLCLFPAILNALSDEGARQIASLDSDSAREIIEKLRGDHDYFMHEMARTIKLLRKVQAADDEDSNEWQDTARQSMIAIRHCLESHNAIEEERVYRWASMLLRGEDQLNLASCVRKELGNLPPRFRES